MGIIGRAYLYSILTKWPINRKAVAMGFFELLRGKSKEDEENDTVADADGNVYKTVKIGNQIWSADNLRTSKFNDGTPITLITDESQWVDFKTPACCFYANNNNNKKKYGTLYNWYAVNTGKLSPNGWHVPTDAEWTELEKYLLVNGYNWDESKEENKIAKSLAAKTGWQTDPNAGTIGNNLSKNNRSGFSALAGGYRLGGGDWHGEFRSIGNGCYWWSSTEFDASNACGRRLFHDLGSLGKDYLNKNCGFNIRVLKNLKED